MHDCCYLGMDGGQVGIPLYGAFQVQSTDGGERTGGSMIETALGFFTVSVCIGLAALCDIILDTGYTLEISRQERRK